jgi:hypothetical protein
MLAVVLEVDPWEQLIDRCENWGEALKWKIHASVSINGRGPSLAPVKTYYARVGGLETQYRSPQSQHWHYGSAPTAKPEPDQQDAALIERAVCSLVIYPHAILRYHHVNRLAPPIVMRLAAKAAGTPRQGNFNGALNDAYAALARALELPAVVQRLRAVERVKAALKGFE